mmetsp:Transcript_20954/g.44779  ORF Transcript_20954/g.44779 Transcript_20954/m.44779 type:complete len:269 (-) Transcript_20954:751-1557(-)
MMIPVRFESPAAATAAAATAQELRPARLPRLLVVVAPLLGLLLFLRLQALPPLLEALLNGGHDQGKYSNDYQRCSEASQDACQKFWWDQRGWLSPVGHRLGNGRTGHCDDVGRVVAYFVFAQGILYDILHPHLRISPQLLLDILHCIVAGLLGQGDAGAGGGLHPNFVVQNNFASGGLRGLQTPGGRPVGGLEPNCHIPGLNADHLGDACRAIGSDRIIVGEGLGVSDLHGGTSHNEDCWLRHSSGGSQGRRCDGRSCFCGCGGGTDS